MNQVQLSLILIPDLCSNGFFFRPLHAPLVLFTWFKKVIRRWQTSLGADGHSLQQSCCKFFKSSKSYPSAVTLLCNISWIYLATKRESQQTTIHVPRQQRFTHHTIIKIRNHVITFFDHVNETNGGCNNQWKSHFNRRLGQLRCTLITFEIPNSLR